MSQITDVSHIGNEWRQFTDAPIRADELNIQIGNLTVRGDGKLPWTVLFDGKETPYPLTDLTIKLSVGDAPRITASGFILP